MFQKILPLSIWKKTRWFSGDFNPIDTNDILDTHKYLTKKHDIKQCFS